jgi:low affinity Fe/Cu permease
MHFSRIARVVADALGTPAAFFAAVALVIVWGIAGPLYHFSDTWQLVINTGTTIATFLIVFLIQNTQNRDARALHLKLDELIHSVGKARNNLIDLENCTDEELDALQRQFASMRNRPRRALAGEGYQTNGTDPKQSAP